MNDNAPKLGFLGIGIMGEAMVTRLLAGGFPVTVWNHTLEGIEGERLAKVLAKGAQRGSSPKAVAAACDLVLVCVLHGAAVRDVVFGRHGVAEAARDKTLLIDFSTVQPEDTRRLAMEFAAASGAEWIDAPVSGGPLLALEGRLTIMAGGSKEGIARAAPVFGALARNANHVGPVGAGQTVKVINQAIVGATWALLAEVAGLAEAAQLDAKSLPKWLTGGFADSVSLQRVLPKMAARDFEPPQSYARQLLKDLENVLLVAKELGAEMPMATRATETYRRFVAEGNEMADSTAVFRLFERRS